MIKNIKHNLSLKLDLIGFSASTICAVHCAIMPFIIVFLPLLGLQFIAEPIVEYLFITVSLIIGAFTFKHGYFNHHKKLYPFLLFLTGFLIILAGHTLFHNHSHEINSNHEFSEMDNILFLMIAPLGAMFIAASHLINRRLSKVSKVCCGQDTEIEKISEMEKNCQIWMSKIYKYNCLISSFSVLLFFFLINGFELFHHHSDSEKIENCKICNCSNTLSKSYIDFKSINLFNNNFELIKTDPVLSPHSFQFIFSNTGRSPPFIYS